MAIKESDNLQKLLDEAKIMCKIGGLLNPDGSVYHHDNVLKIYGVVFADNLVEVWEIPLKIADRQMFKSRFLCECFNRVLISELLGS